MLIQILSKKVLEQFPYFFIGYEEVHVPALKPKTFEADEVIHYNMTFLVFKCVFRQFSYEFKIYVIYLTKLISAVGTANYINLSTDKKSCIAFI